LRTVPHSFCHSLLLGPGLLLAQIVPPESSPSDETVKLDSSQVTSSRESYVVSHSMAGASAVTGH